MLSNLLIPFYVTLVRFFYYRHQQPVGRQGRVDKSFSQLCEHPQQVSRAIHLQHSMRYQQAWKRSVTNMLCIRFDQKKASNGILQFDNYIQNNFFQAAYMDRAYNIMPLNSIFKKRLKMKNGEEITVSPWLERGLGRFSSAKKQFINIILFIQFLFN